MMAMNKPPGWSGIRRVLAAILLGTLGWGCSREAPSSGPHLLLVTIDTLRADHTGLHGYERDTTPRLRDLAAQGVGFDTAYTVMPSTGPSHATMFTGLYPATHGVLWNGMRLGDDQETLAEILATAGYHTAGVVSSFPLSASWGYSQGFAEFLDDFDPASASITQRRWNDQQVVGGFDQRADETTAEAIRWLDETWDRSRPFFLFVHYFDPHGPYQAPGAFATRFRPQHPDALTDTIARYDGEILYADHAIGRLLAYVEASGLDEQTLVVVTADHGEGLMQHGHLEHGIHLYEEAVHVPLVFRWTGTLAGGRVLDQPASLIDLLPTLLDLLGVPSPRQYPGRSLAPLLRGESAPDPERAIFLHRRRYEPQKIGDLFVSGEQWGIRRDDWKLIVGEGRGGDELYRLSIDAREMTNVAAYHPDEVAALRDELEAWRRSAGSHSDPHAPLSDEERQALEALGYVE